MCIFSDIHNVEGITELAIPIYEDLSNFYFKNQNALLLEAVKKKGNKFKHLMLLKQESIYNVRGNNRLMNIINCLSSRHKFDSTFNLINQITLQKYTNIIIPSPTIPSFFKEKLENDPLKEILNLIANKSLQKAAEKILVNSDLNCDIFGFRTVLKNGQSIILGKLDNTFSSFRALAHELGHCLYEINNDYTSIYGSILSELFALIIEQSLSETFLIRKNWCTTKIVENQKYCEALLRLDKLFYMKEIVDLHGGNNFFPILEQLCVFRPSYFTGTGMQIIYGESSLLFSHFKQIAYHQNLDTLLIIFNRLINNLQLTDLQSLVV